MSCMRRCDFFLATDGMWYMLLGDREHAEDECDCTYYGKFASENAAHKYRQDHHSNPGGYCVDDTGTEPPPKHFTDVKKERWM